MSFKKLSLIFITFLLTSVLLLQWWSITRFTENVSRQVGQSAFEVSRSTAETLIFDQPKIEFTSIAVTHSMGTSANNIDPVTQKKINQMLTRVRQDVLLQLVDKQKDDFILLNADGSEYKIAIPRTGIHQALENFSNDVLISTLGLLFLGIILAIYFTHKISSPLKKLQKASVEIGSGSLGIQIKKDDHWQSSEITTTIDSFNQMSLKIKQLQEQNESLQNKAHMAELAEISRGLAHTIRNPLNTLNLAIDQMQSEKNEQDKQQKDNLAKMAKHQIVRIDKWVRSLMDVMSNDENMLKEINLVSVIESVILDQKLSNEPTISFEFDDIFKDKRVTNIRAIEPELKSLLQSLVANAVEASPPNSLINIFLKKERDGFQIKIIDQGKGFSDNILNKLFTPHNTDKTYGAGMGLYLAERVIKHKYGGEIKITNNSPCGSCVTIKLNNRD